MAPLLFLRELACVDAKLRPLSRPECRGFEPLRADGFAHHPYSFGTRPGAPSRRRDDVALGDLERLSALLAALHARDRIESGLPIHLTEYGYETNPPDGPRGVPLDRQALYLSEATAIARAHPDVRSFAQFLLRDVPEPGLYQTGLLLPDGAPKPSLQAFKLPFFVSREGSGLVAFGEVRPAKDEEPVAIERRGRGGAWRQVDALETDGEGVFLRPLERPGTYRFRWARRHGGPEWSGPVTVSGRRP